MEMQYGGDPQVYLQRRLKDIETRMVTMKAMATSALNAATTDAERLAAQRRLDHLDKLMADLDDGPPDMAA